MTSGDSMRRSQVDEGPRCGAGSPPRLNEDVRPESDVRRGLPDCPRPVPVPQSWGLGLPVLFLPPYRKPSRTAAQFPEEFCAELWRELCILKTLVFGMGQR